MINFEDFKKIEIRLGTIKEASKIPDTEKLLKLSIDLGTETRQIVSGISQYFPNPEDLIGRQVPVLVNLEPRMIKGVESNGMVLYAIETSEDGNEVLTTISPKENLKNGSIVR